MNQIEQTRDLLANGHYDRAVTIYEQLIEATPDCLEVYWQLGLAYLLQGKEDEAQATWFSVLMDSDLRREGEQANQSLLQTLELEARQQATQQDYQNAWLIRQQVRDLAPRNSENLLHLIQLTLTLDRFNFGLLKAWDVFGAIAEAPAGTVDNELISSTLKALLNLSVSKTIPLIEACFPHYPSDEFIVVLLKTADSLGYKKNLYLPALELAELAWRLSSQPFGMPAVAVCALASRANRHQRAIEVAKQLCEEHFTTLAGKARGNAILLKALFYAGAWHEIEKVIECHEDYLRQLVEGEQDNFDAHVGEIFLSIFYFPYVRDNIEKNRWLTNQMSQLYQKYIESSDICPEKKIDIGHREPGDKLRIGYISRHLKKHSVGWLSRWLILNHDRSAFHITAYLLYQTKDELAQNWIEPHVDVLRECDKDIPAVVSLIEQDNIDILIDLDSITNGLTCDILAYRPAPIQVTWLGWDASGLPTVDYFIADDYVLPQNAQEFYREKIWRLPKTYVAVGGFETAAPTLRRENLEIPAESTIFFSSQTAFKRLPATVRLQMQIVKQVSDSYFLIKSIVSDRQVLENLFTKIAEEEGVDPKRLRFLFADPTEAIHRANLTIADVILDTYPYNGATTTLEALWMGIPLVTRVGEQFSARNSYTFMVNAGIDEGIAWTDEEYVEWGIRLGTDEALRQQVHWKLMRSRQTSPLWNPKQFAREMENAYRQMWQAYVEQNAERTLNSAQK